MIFDGKLGSKTTRRIICKFVSNLLLLGASRYPVYSYFWSGGYKVVFPHGSWICMNIFSQVYPVVIRISVSLITSQGSLIINWFILYLLTCSPCRMGFNSIRLMTSFCSSYLTFITWDPVNAQARRTSENQWFYQIGNVQTIGRYPPNKVVVSPPLSVLTQCLQIRALTFQLGGVKGIEFRLLSFGITSCRHHFDWL